MEESKMFCPICLEEDYEVLATALYRCNKCGHEFDYDDYEHEELRQRISSVCSALEATEEKPINCELENAMELHISGIYEEAQGLSEAEKPQVSVVFQDDTGIVWVGFKDNVLLDANGYVITDDGIIELDSLITTSLREILSWLEENYRIETLGRV